MSKIKRYGIHFAVEHMMKEDSTGGYVLASDYAALEAECERMRQALTKIHDRCEAFVGDDSGMQVNSVEVLMDIAARGLSASPCPES